MKAAVLYEPGQPLRVEDVQLSPPQAGEVLVRVGAAGVCHSDYHVMHGDMAAPLPAVLDHEGAGVVEQVAPGVTSVAPGDHVVLLWRTSCGHCEYCSVGRPALCPVGTVMRGSGLLADGSSRLSRDDLEIRHFAGVSCFAEHTVCAEQAVLKIPEEVPMPIAAVVGCAVMTGVGAVVNTAKLELATSFGATDVVDSSHEDVVDAVHELTGGGVDYAFEVIGLTRTVEQAVRAVRVGGTAVAVGIVPTGTTAQVDVQQLVMQEKTLKGSIYGSTRPQADFPRLFELYRRGRLPLDRLLTREWPLDRINEAYDALLAGTVARSVVVP